MKKISLFCLMTMMVMMAVAGPKHNAVYHLISKKYTIYADGSMDFRFRKELQLLTTAAFDDFGETFIEYNPEIQSLDINESYTIRKDGSKVQTPKNAFNPSLPYGCTDCERFNKIREMVVTHTALEYDATIVLDYTLHNQNPFMPDLMERIDLYEDAPIDLYEIEVNVPANIALNFFHNYTGKIMLHEMTYNEDSTVMTLRWQYYNLPRKSPEPYLVPDEQPYMLMTTVESPDALVSNLVMQNAFINNSFDGFKMVVDELAPDSLEPMQRVLAIRDYVAENIHTNNVTLRRMNYIVASPFMVWSTNCGTTFEKNLLLYNMLRYAGVSSTIGMLSSTLMSDPVSLVRVTIDKQNYYLSTAENNALSLENVYAPDKFLTITGDLIPFDVATREVSVQAEINMVQKDGYLSPDVQIQRSDIHSPAAGTLMPQDLQVAWTYIIPMGTGYHKVVVSDGHYGCPISAKYLDRQREHNLFVPQTKESYQYEIQLPNNARWISCDYFVEENADFGRVKVALSYGDKVLTVTKELNINTNVITPKQYAKFRKMMAVWQAYPQSVFKME